MIATFVLVLATFVLMRAFAFHFVVMALAAVFLVFLTTFMLMVAALMVAFAFMAFFMLAAFVFAALRLWHVGFHLDHFLCHVDGFCSLLFVEVFPVGKGVDQTILACHHFRAHTWHFTVVVALVMVLIALFFLVFTIVFASCFFFLFVAA